MTLTPDQHRRAREVFLEACRAPEDQRAALIEQQLAGEPSVAAHVRALLAQHSANPTAGTEAAAPGRGARATAAPAAPATAPAYSAGDVIGGRFRVVARLGGGGMGEVYRVEDLTLEQPAAIKRLNPQFAADPEWLARLRQEVRLARQITHPNVCRVFDIHEDAAGCFISMEYVDGEDLRGLLERIGRLPIDKALQVAQEICAGLAAAHARDILHRDLKPANIMLDGRGRVRLTDFGLAVLQDQVPRSEIAAGTLAYMAPEQRHGRAVTAASDIFALGIVLHELFTGERPETADEPGRRRAVAGSATDSAGEPLLPPDVAAVIEHCLASDPRARPGSVLEVAGALPGGDALAAALAAGQLPTPSLVAAARAEPVWGAARAGAALAAVIALLAALFTLLAPGHPMVAAKPQKSSDVLADRAESVLAEIGFKSERVSSAGGWLPRMPEAAPEAAVQAAGRGPVYWWRCSEARLTPRDPMRLVFGGARCRPDDPPWERGDALLVFGADERLRYLRWTPSAGPQPADSVVIAARLSSAAGRADAPPFTEWTSTPDGWSAWPAAEPGAQHPLRLRTAPELEFVITDPSATSAAELHAREAAAFWVYFAMFAVLIGLSIPLSIRNVRLGRSDHVNAFRAASLVGGLRLTASLLELSWPDDAQLLAQYLTLALVGALAEGVAVWVLYQALEPLVRRFAPHALVSWVHALDGRWRSPDVAQHVSIGVLLGIFGVVWIRLDSLVPAWLGLATRPAIPELDFLGPVDSGVGALASVLEAIRSGAYMGLGVMLLTVLLRAATRSPLGAGLLTALVLACLVAPRGAHAGLSWAFLGAGLIGGLVFGALRFGLLAGVTMIAVVYALNRVPLTFGDAWYAESGWAAAAVLLGLAGLCTWISALAARPPTGSMRRAG